MCLLTVCLFEFYTERDVPEPWEDPVMSLVPSGEGESVPSVQVEVKGTRAKGGDPTIGLEVAGPVLGGLNPFAVDVNESLQPQTPALMRLPVLKSYS